MKPLEFINNWLERNTEFIPIESALYEYRPFSETHFLNIAPGRILKDAQYEELLSNFIFEFDKEFPSEGLCLIDNDSLTKLENPRELIPISLPDIAPFYQEAVHTKYSFEVYSLPKINWFEITKPLFADLKFPIPDENQWTFSFNIPLTEISEFSGVTYETQVQNTSEELYSIDDEFQNKAA